MSYVNVLREQRNAPTVAYLKYLLNSGNSAISVHVFFEGDDDESFYLGILNHYVQDARKIAAYVCGNKRGVLKVWDLIDALPTKSGTNMFFVDKDLDDIIGDAFPVAPNIFTTRYYSIENYLVNPEVLERVLAEIFNLTGVSIEWGPIREGFLQQLSKFHEMMIPLTAWVIHTRRLGLNPNINNVRMPRLFGITNDLEIQATCGLDAMFDQLDRQCLASPARCQRQDIGSIEAELSNLQPKAYVRGKFEMWFFISYIAKLGNVIRAKARQAGGTLKMRVQLDEHNSISVLGPRLLTIPTELIGFIQAQLN